MKKRPNRTLFGSSTRNRNYRILYERQKGKCAICGGKLDLSLKTAAEELNPWRPEIDHIVECARGGSNRIDNLQLTHRFCNQRKDWDNGKRRQYR